MKQFHPKYTSKELDKVREKNPALALGMEYMEPKRG